MRKELCHRFSDKIPQTDLCSWLSLARSSYYYQPSNEKRGAKPSTTTTTVGGKVVSNEEVVNTLIKKVFSQEFNRYGYRLCTEELKDMGFLINHKKLYRLMKAAGLLLEKKTTARHPRQWVKWRKVRDVKPMEHLCMDIKYVYIQGEKRNAYLLVIMDMATRFVLSWSLNYSMKHTNVILCLFQALQGYQTKGILLRTDNGSQFIAEGLRKYCLEKQITQEFTHFATPEENAYAESLFSCVQRDVIQAFEFDSLYHARDIFQRYFKYHNTRRRRHALNRKSPLNYWNAAFYSHPVKPPETHSEGFVKGDDKDYNILPQSSFYIPLTKT